VAWTFDPLLARNAYLNIYKLGATGQRYEADYFGASQYAMISGDRLVINWWVNHPHTIAHIQGEVPKYTVQQYLEHDAAIVNPVTVNDMGCPVPLEKNEIPANSTLLLEIPAEFTQLQQQDMALAQTWRNHIRQVFPQVMKAGYVVTNFIRDGERTFYVFTRDDGSFRFITP
jgi:predicted GNAT superfamily acetyltransferase